MTPETQDRAAILKAATKDMHDALDSGIMRFNPFQDAARYGAFLQMQHAFHRDVASLFSSAELNALFPGLAQRQRFTQVAQDLADLGLPAPGGACAPAFGDGPVDVPTALGWLYVEEGSNLGGAFLYKAAAKLGFDAAHGARHLAPHPQGRAPSWKVFVGQLNAVPLSSQEQARVVAGAIAAFRAVTGYMDTFCAAPATA